MTAVPFTFIFLLLLLAMLAGGAIAIRFAYHEARQQAAMRGFGRYHPMTRRWQWRSEVDPNEWETET